MPELSTSAPKASRQFNLRISQSHDILTPTMFSPSEDPSPLISISSVTATQLTGPVATPLTTGTLYLTTPPPALSPLPKLLLQISSLSSRTYTLPLTASTSIFSDSERTFLINTDDLTTTITFPTTVSSSTALKFEKILLAHGFLSTGLVADADDIAGAMRDSATKTVEKLQSYTSRRVQTRERAEPWEEKEYSERAKKVMSGTVDGTDKAAEVTGRVGRAVSSAAESIGEWVGGIMPGKKEGQEGGVAKEAVKGAVEGMGVVGAGAAERYVFLRLFGGCSADSVKCTEGRGDGW
jgi:hypothetical protein